MRLVPSIKDPSPAVEQYMDDPLEDMDKSEIEIQRKLMDEKLNNSEEEIIMYIMPFELMVGDYDGPKFE
jgi:hypothetical protein